MPQGMCPAQPARRENLPSPEESLPGLHHQECPQTHPAESLCAMANAPLHPRHAMICVKKIHIAPHPSTGTNPTVTRAARTKRVASSCRNVWHLHHRGSLLLNRQRRSLASRGLPGLLTPPPRVSIAVPLDTSVREMTRLLSWAPTAPSTPNKTEGGPCIQSVSSDSRCSMTLFETGLGGSFSVPSYVGVHHSSITPVTSVAGSQQVTSSGWHQSASFSPLTPQGTDTLSAEQAIEIYQLTTECWDLGYKLAKQFQTLSRLEAMHHTAA